MRSRKVRHQCHVCGSVFWEHLSQGRKYCSRKCYDIKQRMLPNDSAFVKGHKRGMTGKRQSTSMKQKLSRRLTGHKFWGGESGWFRKGGHPSVCWHKGHIPWNKGMSLNPDHSLRMSRPYGEWRKAVLARDNYTCQICGKRGGKIIADHIKPYSKFPELRLSLANGRTLCVDCHRDTPTYGLGVLKWHNFEKYVPKEEPEANGNSAAMRR